jgi:arylsulfatase A-like enzyme
MPRFAPLLLPATFLLAIGSGCLAADPQPPRRNVVLILADDLGFMDVGCNNARTFYETPNLDRLAARGMRFTAGYAACPVCSPTRASILTGKVPPRTGVTDFIGGRRAGRLQPAPYQHQLALDEVTLAEVFRDAGYRTFFAGKWHLGDGAFSPNAQGFGPDLAGGGQFYYPADAAASRRSPEDPKATDAIADAAVRFIRANRGRPFFAYLPFLAVHIPVGARPDLIAKYQRKKQALPPRPPSASWGAEGPQKVRLVQDDAAYAAMLEQLDAAVGRVLKALDEEGIADRTAVVFTSDNGGLSTAEGHPTSNAPLRAGKGWLYEGGIRVPWIIAAPGVTAPGSTCATPVLSTDLFPTALALAGVAVPPDPRRDGMSLVPLLEGRSLDRGPLFWHYPHYSNQGGPPAGGVLDGDWKLIEWYEDGRRELYNLRDDPGERDDQAARQPDRVAAMQARLAAWRKDVGALMPIAGPAAR